jgi:hypothetical protein
MVLGQIDYVMQIAGSLDDHPIRFWIVNQERLCGLPDAIQMVDIVCAIFLIVYGCQGNQAQFPVCQIFLHGEARLSYTDAILSDFSILIHAA